MVAPGQRTTALLYPAQTKTRHPATLILAHGAGAPQQHPFMVSFARALSERGLDVVTFNFLYTEQRRKVPDRMPQLVACYRAVIEAARAELPSARERLFIGGKSMGGRAATHVAADDAALTLAGIVLLGYPLHPPGRPDQLRDAHLPDVRRPMLFVQGSRDTFGTPSELKPILASLVAAADAASRGRRRPLVQNRGPRRQGAAGGGVRRDSGHDRRLDPARRLGRLK